MTDVSSASLCFQNSAEPQTEQKPRFAEAEASYQVIFSAPSTVRPSSATFVAA